MLVLGQFSIQCCVLKVFIYSKTSRQRPTFLNPSTKLSTVVQPAYKIGTRTARMLLDQLERKQKMKDFEKIVLQTYLKIN
jgi:hypothetical protein